MKIITLIVCVIVLAACVRTSSTMLSQDTAIISGRGNAYVDPAEVIQKTLAEAATITKARDYRYFVIVGATDQTRTGAMYIPGQTYSSGTATGSATVIGNSVYGSSTYSGTSQTTPGSVVPVIKPGMDVTIRMFREGEIDPTTSGVWDAESVLAVQQTK